MSAAVLSRGALTAVLVSTALVAPTPTAWAARGVLVSLYARTPVTTLVAEAHFSPYGLPKNFSVCDLWHHDKAPTIGELTLVGQRKITLTAPNMAKGQKGSCKLITLTVKSGTTVNVLLCTNHGRLCKETRGGVA